MTSVFAPAPEHAPRHRAAGTAASPARRPERYLEPAHAPRRAPQPRPEPLRAPAGDRRPNLRVVGPQERTARRLTPLAGVVLTGIVFAVLFAVAGAHTVIAQGQIRLDGLDRQVRAEQARYQDLAKDVAQMESPDRIVAAAEAQGMVTPQDLVYLQPDTAAHPIASGSTSDADPDADARRSLDAASTRSWSTVKPLLEAPAP
jgi:cell division protein FtsL